MLPGRGVVQRGVLYAFGQRDKYTSGQFHFRRAAFSAQLKSKVGLALAKAPALRINLNRHTVLWLEYGLSRVKQDLPLMGHVPMDTTESWNCV